MSDPLERRRYIRLNSVFPVSFQPCLPKQSPGKLYQAFTQNVSLEGLCLELKQLDDHLKEWLLNSETRLRLVIDIPMVAKGIEAIAKIAWLHTQEDVVPMRYFIGIRYEKINLQDKTRIFAYAKRVRNLPRYVIAAILVLVIMASLSFGYNIKVRCKNQLLVDRTVKLAQRYSHLEGKLLLAQDKEGQLKSDIKKGVKREGELKRQMLNLQETIETAKELKNQEGEEVSAKQEILMQTLKDLQAEKARLDKQLTQVLKNKKRLSTNLVVLKKESQDLHQKGLDNMYRWLKVQQSSRTGLLTSFEGDRSLRNWAFTYDQALAAQVFTLFGDYSRVQMIFDFYQQKAQRTDGAFANAFNARRGDVAEYLVHSGPNIWLGIAILQYTNKTKDRQYLLLAESIADWAIDLQNEDTDFGIRGGPKESWFSTEHNLDAYALFVMFYDLTQKDHYKEASGRSLNWLMKHARNETSPPVKRGKGDATIATDTFSWAISSLGPEILIENEMDPEQIIKFAEENCAVEVDYERPEGEVVKVRGFDFAKYTHLPRGGLVSTEWTAQMIVAYQVMGDYFSKNGALNKANQCYQKGDFYLNELGKMVISSPSKTGQGEGCLPYASAAFADTGHGWRTPKGNRTGSVAGTAYTIFASLRYNPLSFP